MTEIVKNEEKTELLRSLQTGHPVFLDGATGSNLQKAGMPAGVCPEQWVLENPDALRNLQNAYLDAGTNILYAPTFSGNRIKLKEFGLEGQLKEINGNLVKLCRSIAGDRALVAGDMTLTGQSLEPIGDLTLDELIDVYKEQAAAIYEAGPDLFVVETMMSLPETRAAVIAIREVCDLPIIVSMTFGEGGKTLYGTSPETAMAVLQSLGADVIGSNCSTGPDRMKDIVSRMKQYAKVPILAKPNAGLPKYVNGETTYDMAAEPFSAAMPGLVEAGASFLGGCCGTTPEHIRQLKAATEEMQTAPVAEEVPDVISTERQIMVLPADHSELNIGRICAAEDEELRNALADGDLDGILDLIEELEDADAEVICLNLDMEGIDVKETMLEAMGEVTFSCSLPLCFASADPEVIRAALRKYPGRALVDTSVVAAQDKETLEQVIAWYGAAVL